MAPKKSQKAKAEEQAQDADVEVQPAPAKDKSKVPGGKAGGAASGQLCITARTPKHFWHEAFYLETSPVVSCHMSLIAYCCSMSSLSTPQA